MCRHNLFPSFQIILETLHPEFGLTLPTVKHHWSFVTLRTRSFTLSENFDSVYNKLDFPL